MQINIIAYALPITCSFNLLRLYQIFCYYILCQNLIQRVFWYDIPFPVFVNIVRNYLLSPTGIDTINETAIRDRLFNVNQ